MLNINYFISADRQAEGLWCVSVVTPGQAEMWGGVVLIKAPSAGLTNTSHSETLGTKNDFRVLKTTGLPVGEEKVHYYYGQDYYCCCL